MKRTSLLFLHFLEFFAVIILSGRVHGKPALEHAPRLMVYLQDAPEAREGHDSEDARPEKGAGEEGCDKGSDARQEESPVDSRAEIVFPLDNEGVENSYDKEGDKTDGQTFEIDCVHGKTILYAKLRK